MTKSSERRVHSAEEKLAALERLSTEGTKAVARDLGVSTSTIYWWKRMQEEGKSLEPVPPGPERGQKRKPKAQIVPRNGDPIADAFTGRPRRGEQIQLFQNRGESLSAQEEIRRLQREVTRLKRVVATLLDE